MSLSIYRGEPVNKSTASSQQHSASIDSIPSVRDAVIGMWVGSVCEAKWAAFTHGFGPLTAWCGLSVSASKGGGHALVHHHQPPT
jgi:hypothetical protein